MYTPKHPLHHLEALSAQGGKAWLAAAPFYWHLMRKASRNSLETLHSGEIAGDARARRFPGLGRGIWRLYQP